jgi:hypothetical protein
MSFGKAILKIFDECIRMLPREIAQTPRRTTAFHLSAALESSLFSSWITNSFFPLLCSGTLKQLFDRETPDLAFKFGIADDRDPKEARMVTAEDYFFDR